MVGERGLSSRARRLLFGAVALGVAVALVVMLVGPRSSADHGRVVQTFEVPSSRWWGLSGMAAEVRGTLSFEGDCPVLIPEEVGGGILIFPWAEGVTYADGTRAVVHRVTGGVYAEEGGVVDAAGGWDEPSGGDDWEPACEGSSATANIYVNSWP